MIVVDTSVWIGHFRDENRRLARLLESRQVLSHPMIIGELACGNLPARQDTLRRLARLPQAPLATHQEVLALIGRSTLMGRALSYIDVHVLASTLLDPDALLWTFDRRLRLAAEELHVAVDDERPPSDP